MTRFFAIPLGVRVGVFAWLVLLVGVGVRVSFAAPTSQSVVPIYRHAAHRWLAGGDLYAYEPGLDVYRNPPGFAAGFVPFAALPPKTAGVVWRAVGAAVFLSGLWAFVRDVLPPLSAGQRGWLFAAAVPGALLSLNNGQVNVLLAGAVLLGSAAAARGKNWQAAGWLSLAAWLKVYPLAAGLLLCVLFPRRLGWRFAVALGVGFGLPFLFADPGYVWGQYQSFAGYLGAEDRTFAPLSQVPRDWAMVPRMWLDVIPPPPVVKAVSLLAAGLFAVLTWRAGTAFTATGLALVWMTLFGPATENPTYTLLAPLSAAALVLWRGWRLIAAWAAWGLFLAVVVRGSFPTSEVLPLRTAQPVAAGLLLAGLLRGRVRLTTSFAHGVKAPRAATESGPYEAF